MIKEQNKRRLGAKAEQAVRKYLEAHGIDVVEMNYRCRQGEVDVIAKDGEYYVFIEVKYRNTVQYGLPQEAVDKRKQQRISKAAFYYLYSHGMGDTIPVRFDVAAIQKEQILYVKNAFDYCGMGC
ncbi:MAG: YraN family protein [Clostridiales bacterium]|nr:YraN family protein [Clostridiales bacterium]